MLVQLALCSSYGRTMLDLMWLECQQFLQDEGIEAMDWPARSPDCPQETIRHLIRSMPRRCREDVVYLFINLPSITLPKYERLTQVVTCLK
ncbi:hypothetical protein NFI96_033393, partial [Prochilodus magdalenae]